MRWLLALLLWSLSSAAVAQAPAPFSFEEVATQARYYETFPGPYPDSHRGVSIWRPPGAGEAVLPVVYMADGARGLYAAVAWLAPAIAAGDAPPIMVIGIDPNPRLRANEYIRDRSGGGRRFDAHARWVIERVIPWAERNVGASPTQRVIGGYSNGGDFALSLAAAYPEHFVGVLAHAPVASDRFVAPDNAARARWAVSAGRGERNGLVARNARSVQHALTAEGARVRTCIGPWGHEMSAWRDLSPGAILWLFGMTPPTDVETALERDNCRTFNGNSP